MHRGSPRKVEGVPKSCQGRMHWVARGACRCRGVRAPLLTTSCTAADSIDSVRSAGSLPPPLTGNGSCGGGILSSVLQAESVHIAPAMLMLECRVVKRRRVESKSGSDSDQCCDVQEWKALPDEELVRVCKAHGVVCDVAERPAAVERLVMQHMFALHGVGGPPVPGPAAADTDAAAATSDAGAPCICSTSMARVCHSVLQVHRSCSLLVALLQNGREGHMGAGQGCL